MPKSVAVFQRFASSLVVLLDLFCDLRRAWSYPRPSSFSRGLRLDIKAVTILRLISGTASVVGNGQTIHAGDFRAPSRDDP